MKIIKKYWWVWLWLLLTIIVSCKFSDAPSIIKTEFVERFFAKPEYGTIAYDLLRILEVLNLAFVASMIFYFFNVVLRNQKRREIINNEVQTLLDVLLDSMKTPFEHIAQFYIDHPSQCMKFENCDLSMADKIEDDVDLKKLGPYLLIGGRHKQNLVYIYDYIRKTEETINMIFKYESSLEEAFYDDLLLIPKSNYHVQYKRMYEDPCLSNYITPEESRELIEESYRFTNKKHPLATQGFQIGTMDTTTLRQYIELYRKLMKYKGKKVIIRDI